MKPTLAVSSRESLEQNQRVADPHLEAPERSGCSMHNPAWIVLGVWASNPRSSDIFQGLMLIPGLRLWLIVALDPKRELQGSAAPGLCRKAELSSKTLLKLHGLAPVGGTLHGTAFEQGNLTSSFSRVRFLIYFQ